MSLKFDVSLLEKDDLKECAGLFIETFNASPWNENWSKEAALERLENFYDQKRSFGLKVVSAGGAQAAALTGFLIGVVESYSDKSSFYLQEMCVLPGSQKQGLGSMLMAKLQARLKEKGVSSIYLITKQGAYSESFYQKAGFAEIEYLSVMGKEL